MQDITTARLVERNCKAAQTIARAAQACDIDDEEEAPR